MTIKQNNLINAVKKANSELELQEKFPLPLIAVRAKKAALGNPEDQSLRLLANVFGKMSENGKVFITRAEFKNIFSKFASSEGYAARCFSEELGTVDEKPIRQLAGQEVEPLEFYAGADPTISNALSVLWDNNGKVQKMAESKVYDPNKARQANKLTEMELSRMGVAPKAINTFAGTDTFIICQATYETPMGESHLLIPVELSKSGALIPTFFVSKFGFADLNKNTIEENIVACAGKSFTVNSEALLNALSVAKEASFMDEFEIKTLAMQEAINSKRMVKEASDNKSTVMYSGNNIFAEGIDSAENSVVALPQSEESYKFANSLGTAKGVAEFVFGKNIVEAGRSAIISKLALFGHNSQVSVAACDDKDNTITYAVSIAHKSPIGFEIMAEVTNGKVVIPAMVAMADKAYNFTKSGIDSILSSNTTDYRMYAAVSPLYELGGSAVLENIRKAADEGDYKKAEEGLAVLSERNDVDNYKIAIAEYIRSVSGNKLTKTASAKCGCTKIVKSANHTGPICGHLNLPIEKVYQNERGECTPLYRKNMSDTYEGVLFNTSKILG